MEIVMHVESAGAKGLIDFMSDAEVAADLISNIVRRRSIPAAKWELASGAEFTTGEMTDITKMIVEFKP